MNENYTATYSPEDNKLRLYAATRLDEETYQRVKKAGFKWAPKQELFVAPSWSPSREDLLVELAGEILPEETSLSERAAMKAERLDGLIEKRKKDASAFHAAASAISERFYMGQPILVGHHSERKARKDQERMDSAMEKAVAAQKAARYWADRAEGVERHANRKNDPRTRANRIKTLLADLRSHQRKLNFAQHCLDLWTKIKRDEAVLKESGRYEKIVQHYAGASGGKDGSTVYAPKDDPRFDTEFSWRASVWDVLRKGEITPEEVVDLGIEQAEYNVANPRRLRYIEHTLNRLDYERGELGPVTRYEGGLTAAILQTFCRTHGAEKPKAVKTEDGWDVTSTIPLPYHIANGEKFIAKTDDDWRDLMESVGYEVPQKKTASQASPLLNFRCKALVARMYGNVSQYPQVEMTKSEYSAIHSDYKGTRFDLDNTFRFRTAMVKQRLVSVFLTDSKVHDTPDSQSIIPFEEGEEGA